MPQDILVRDGSPGTLCCIWPLMGETTNQEVSSSAGPSLDPCRILRDHPHLSEMHSALSHQRSPPKPTAQVLLLGPKVSIPWSPIVCPSHWFQLHFWLCLLSPLKLFSSVGRNLACGGTGFSDPRALWQPPPHFLRCCRGIICPHKEWDAVLAVLVKRRKGISITRLLGSRWASHFRSHEVEPPVCTIFITFFDRTNPGTVQGHRPRPQPPALMTPRRLSTVVGTCRWWTLV